MKAVNLIPNELRGGASAPARTGSAVYVLLGVLGAAVVLVSAWALVGRQITQREADVARVTAEAEAAEARAGELAPYAKFAKVRTDRVETVSSIARSRFNWPFALREVSRVMPSDVWLSSLTGTVAPTVSVEGGSGSGSGLRGSLPVPAIEIAGCTTDQANVARYITRLRQISGVTRVSLGSSEKGGSGGGGGGAGGGCAGSSGTRPQFQLVAFFERSRAGVGGASAGSPAAGAQTTPSTTTGAGK